MPSQRVALVSAGVLLALALIVLTIGHVRHASPSADAAANDPHARALLVDTTAAAHVLFVEHGSYMAVTPAALGRRMPAVPVVSASTAAGAGQVSVQVVNATTFIAATPATGGGCVFARAEPVKARVGFAATATGPCRAAGAPPRGWRGT